MILNIIFGILAGWIASLCISVFGACLLIWLARYLF